MIQLALQETEAENADEISQVEAKRTNDRAPRSNRLCHMSLVSIDKEKVILIVIESCHANDYVAAAAAMAVVTRPSYRPHYASCRSVCPSVCPFVPSGWQLEKEKVRKLKLTQTFLRARVNRIPIFS